MPPRSAIIRMTMNTAGQCGKHGRHHSIKTQIELSAKVAGTEMGRMSQIVYHLEERIHWMMKYSQDKDEELQRFRNPPGSWWTDQVKTCKTNDCAC